ncbi:hypothetical protein JJD41_08230 [Oxynema sp. CENA135]|uniref:hypothetical protein n=1 Tax=Oxynema sp. CENA135 TaxID=984206 RepID=UPI00190BC75C|nr:hypothetical protein [Oxynema sp. CENA135]MBK4729851.1 hypothetical protein [Oxynema sp. CENA135]
MNADSGELIPARIRLLSIARIRGLPGELSSTYRFAIVLPFLYIRFVYNFRLILRLCQALESGWLALQVKR